MADEAFASFERKWLDANPEQMAVLNFLDAASRRRVGAFGTLIHELTQTAFAVRETGVAAAKLAWWQQELVAASAGNARHPITRELFADARARAIDTATWHTLGEGALAQLETPSPATLDDAVAHLSAFFVPVAMLEARLEHSAESKEFAALWILSHLLKSLAAGSVAAERFAWPLDLLAKHRVAHADSLGAVPMQRDLLGQLRARLTAALASATAASVARRVRARSDLAVIAHAQRASNLPVDIAAGLSRVRLRHVFWAWRAARRRDALEDAPRNPS